MSLAAVCAWCFVRSAGIALVAVLASKRLAASVTRDSLSLPAARESGRLAPSTALRFRAWSHRAVWVLLLAPFLVPHLLVGYAYSALALKLIHHPGWNEAAYTALLWLKFFAVAVVIQIFAPPSPVSPEAIHCQRLLRRPGEPWLLRMRQELACWLAGPGRPAIAGFVVVFLVAFQEFEIASLMGITAVDAHSPVSWTVWLFDAHAGGVPLSESLKDVLVPLAFELCDRKVDRRGNRELEPRQQSERAQQLDHRGHLHRLAPLGTLNQVFELALTDRFAPATSSSVATLPITTPSRFAQRTISSR